MSGGGGFWCVSNFPSLEQREEFLPGSLSRGDLHSVTWKRTTATSVFCSVSGQNMFSSETYGIYPICAIRKRDFPSSLDTTKLGWTVVANYSWAASNKRQGELQAEA